MTLPLAFAVTLDASTSARTSFSIVLIPIEIPTAIAPAFPPVEAPTAMAIPIAFASMTDWSVAETVTLPATPVRPFAVTVLPPLTLAWM